MAKWIPDEPQAAGEATPGRSGCHEAVSASSELDGRGGLRPAFRLWIGASMTDVEGKLRSPIEKSAPPDPSIVLKLPKYRLTYRKQRGRRRGRVEEQGRAHRRRAAA
jgi:hypothetical protein